MTIPKICRTAAIIAAIALCTAAYHVPAYASVGEIAEEDIDARVIESMTVSASWLDDETLRINVLDTETGSVSSLAVRFSDFVTDSGNSPFILIQAVDPEGGLSGVIRIENPFYNLTEANSNTDAEPPDSEYEAGDENGNDYTEPPQLGLTPDGTGTVVDNVTNRDGVEFFTVFTEDGNEFFLIVDRQRSTDNVYLLNAVTEEDLMALAQASGRPAAVSQIPPAPEPPQPESPVPAPEPEPEPQARQGFGFGNIIIILTAAAAAGGAGYYFKIYKPKQDAEYFDEEDEMGFDRTLHEVDDGDFADDGFEDGDRR